MNTKEFLRGVKAGFAIGLGYLSVSFTFGIMAASLGLSWWQATLVSMLTVTSAGQLAGVQIMVNPGQYIQMVISQLTINIRYSFMSITIGQKADSKFAGIHRWILGFMMTDEIFAVASQEKEVNRIFFSGLCVLPYLGWSLGTLLGAVLGNVLPEQIMSALGLAIYGMFVAIIVPVAKKEMPILLVVAIAILLSCAFYYVPFLANISAGISISLCAIISAVIVAIIFPVDEEECNE